MIAISAAEAREAAEFRRLCEIVWWRAQAVATDGPVGLDDILKPSRLREVVMAREDVAWQASEAGASREAIGCILSVSAHDAGQMISRARARRSSATRPAMPGLHLIGRWA